MSLNKKFVIVANPRTGTNHFIDLLNSHVDITCHREVFHRDSVYMLEGTRDDLLEKRNQDSLGFLKQLYDNSPTWACGFKIFMGHNDEVLDHVLYNESIRKIILFRPNFLAVYSSDLIAAAEQRYLVMEEKPRANNTDNKYISFTKAKAFFDRKIFEQRMKSYLKYYSHAIEVMNKTNQEYLFVTYEDYINDSLFRRVFPFLGLTQPNKIQTRMKKMNSSNILSRFENPDDVNAYLEEIDRLDWIHEGFMSW